MNGSIDSMDKSQFNSSLDDTHSYDIYEAHNPHPAFGYAASATSTAVGGGANVEFNKAARDPRLENEAVNAIVHPPFNLAFRNEGYKDNSTFASREPIEQHGASVSYKPERHHTPPDERYNDATLPIGSRSFHHERNREIDETVSSICFILSD
jgi:hypothetical protein